MNYYKCTSLIFLLYIFSSNYIYADCNCKSTNQSEPCSGNRISTTVSNGSREITFTWSIGSGHGDAYCGQFANGDYWIAPKTPNIDITVLQLTSSGSGPVSLDENPQLESMGLLDPNITYGNYITNENILSLLPLSFTDAASLVAAVKKDENSYGTCGTKAIEGNCVDAYNILTILQEVPPNAGSTILRPSIDETTKELISISDFDLSRLPGINYFEGTNQEGLEAIRQRWSHSLEIFSMRTIEGAKFSEGGRAFRADLLLDDYAAGVAAAWHDDLATILSSDHNIDDIIPAIASMLTYGKDIFFSVYDIESDNSFKRTRNWGGGAGQALGKLPAAALFAALSVDDVYSNVMSEISNNLLGYSDFRGPQEMEQINVNNSVDGVIPVWGDFSDEMTEIDIGAYWASMLKSQCFDGAALGECNTNFGRKTSRDPYGYIDGPPNLPGSNYFVVALGPMRALASTMELIPELKRTINYPELTEFVLRVHNSGLHTKDDPCAPPDPREDPLVCDAYRQKNCQYYGLSNTGTWTWGPDPQNPSQCIKNSNGQNGRFASKHGETVKYVYISNQIETNWDKIHTRPNPPTN